MRTRITQACGSESLVSDATPMLQHSASQCCRSAALSSVRPLWPVPVPVFAQCSGVVNCTHQQQFEEMIVGVGHDGSKRAGSGQRDKKTKGRGGARNEEAATAARRQRRQKNGHTGSKEKDACSRGIFSTVSHHAKNQAMN